MSKKRAFYSIKYAPGCIIDISLLLHSSANSSFRESWNSVEELLRVCFHTNTSKAIPSGRSDILSIAVNLQYAGE